MEKPLISLAIPVYNTSKYLKKCLESAIAQTYPNLEIVVLNNGSTDSSQDIIDEMAIKDSRIKAFAIDHVPTIKESRDNCYRRTKGEWVIPLDSDDSISHDYVDLMWTTHLVRNADMVVSQRVSVDEDGNEYNYLPTVDFDFSIVYPGKEACRRTIVTWEMSVNGALVNKKNLDNIMLHNPDCKVFTDEYDSRVLLKNAQRVAYSPARYYYTFNPNSVGKTDNWNRHRFRLNTRLGLLGLCEDMFTIKSKEYQSIVTQGLGISYIAILHHLKNKKTYSDADKLELKQIVNSIISNSSPSCSLQGIFNWMAKTVLRVAIIII